MNLNFFGGFEVGKRNTVFLASLALLTAPGVVLVASEAGAAPSCGGRVATVVGTPTADHLVGTKARDVIVAGGGADTVYGGGGNDLVCGGSGNDQLYGGGGRDRLRGEQGDDQLRDFHGNGGDRLRGGPGDDVIGTGNVGKGFGFRGKELAGGVGADLLISGDGSQRDSLRGGPDADILVSAGHVRGDSASHEPDRLDGGAGHDILRSQRGGLTDFLLIGDGDLVRVRNDGNPKSFHPTSTRLWYRGAPGPVAVDLLAGRGRVIGSSTGDTIRGLDDAIPMDVLVSGTPGDDQIFGHSSRTLRELLRGEGGDDEVHGRGSGDWLIGSRGDDLLDGGGGFDQGNGDVGRDTCISIEFAETCEVNQ